jgi:hypothetical protein
MTFLYAIYVMFRFNQHFDVLSSVVQLLKLVQTSIMIG